MSSSFDWGKGPEAKFLRRQDEYLVGRKGVEKLNPGFIRLSKALEKAQTVKTSSLESLHKAEAVDPVVEKLQGLEKDGTVIINKSETNFTAGSFFMSFQYLGKDGFLETGSIKNIGDAKTKEVVKELEAETGKRVPLDDYSAYEDYYKKKVREDFVDSLEVQMGNVAKGEPSGELNQSGLFELRVVIGSESRVLYLHDGQSAEEAIRLITQIAEKGGLADDLPRALN